MVTLCLIADKVSSFNRPRLDGLNRIVRIHKTFLQMPEIHSGMFRHNRNRTFAIHPLVVRVFIVKSDFTAGLNDGDKSFQPASRVRVRNLHAELVNLEGNQAGFFL